MSILSSLALPELAARVPTPSYDRSLVRTGIVHFGVGGFHRAHQAMPWRRRAPSRGVPLVFSRMYSARLSARVAWVTSKVGQSM